MYIIIGDNMFSNELICNILIYINDNLKQKISIQTLEEKFYYNRYYIMKLFKKEIGLTITDYINSLKIYNAIKFIETNNNNMLNIALISGFNSLEYFSEMCKKITEVNPTIIKKYLYNKNNIDEDTKIKITNSINKLYNISNIKKDYLSKRKIKDNLIKKLTIFK